MAKKKEGSGNGQKISFGKKPKNGKQKKSNGPKESKSKKSRGQG